MKLKQLLVLVVGALLTFSCIRPIPYEHFRRHRSAKFYIKRQRREMMLYPKRQNYAPLPPPPPQRRGWRKNN